TPLLERRLGDNAISRSVAALFENVLLDEQWLKRYLKIPQTQAREAARLVAFRQMLRFRRKAALLAHALELYARGPVPAGAGDGRGVPDPHAGHARRRRAEGALPLRCAADVPHGRRAARVGARGGALRAAARALQRGLLEKPRGGPVAERPVGEGPARRRR